MHFFLPGHFTFKAILWCCDSSDSKNPYIYIPNYTTFMLLGLTWSITGLYQNVATDHLYTSSTCTHMHKEMCLSQWRAFKNHPCAREHTSCIYMHNLLSLAQQYACAPLSFPSAPRALITIAARAHLSESTRPGDRHTHTDAHASKQTSHQTIAPSNSSVGGWRGWRSLLQAQLSCTNMHTDTSKTLHYPRRTHRLRMRPVGLLSCL